MVRFASARSTTLLVSLLLALIPLLLGGVCPVAVAAHSMPSGMAMQHQHHHGTPACCLQHHPDGNATAVVRDLPVAWVFVLPVSNDVTPAPSSSLPQPHRAAHAPSPPGGGVVPLRV